MMPILFFGSPEFINALVAIISSLISAGMVSKWYENKKTKEKEKEQGDSQYQIARVTDSAQVVDKLLPQIEKLFAVERELINEKIVHVNKIEELNREVLRLSLEKAEIEERNATLEVRVSTMMTESRNQEAQIKQLTEALAMMQKQFKNISFNEEKEEP
jgi:hypothetical protein